MRNAILCGLIIICGATISFGQELMITAQRDLRVEAGKSITLSLNDITVQADNQLNYPNGFYLRIDDGDYYKVNGTTVTPNRDFTGTLEVKIRVTNGDKKSDKFVLKITVFRNGEDDDDDDEDDDDDDDDDDESNAKPSIVSQTPIEIDVNESFTIHLSHLTVNDPDNDYPDDFTLKIDGGDNFNLSGSTVTPTANFTGTLTVKVRVNDGHKNSEPFNFLITVKELIDLNVKPVITAHASLSTFKNESVTLRLDHLSVTDPDNNYPDDFSLKIKDGSDYTRSGNTVTPSSDFVGTITVNVQVNDGRDDSDVFPVSIDVVEHGTLQILGQVPIVINEDASYKVLLTDLTVSDPSGTFPSAFKLSIQDGENYSIENSVVKPERNFHGNLSVPIQIEKDGTRSEIFTLLIIVQPINDPPAFSTFYTEPVMIGQNGVDVAISREVVAADVDDTKLTFAEIMFDSTAQHRSFGFANTEHINGLTDEQYGILVMRGDATLEEYSQALQSITVSYEDTTRRDMTVKFRLYDGEAYSDWYEKQLIVTEREFLLDIPTAFTPNNDHVNDAWDIRLLRQNEDAAIEVKVYNNRGMMVFKSDSFEQQWDGRFNGEVLPADTYFYTITVEHAAAKVRQHGAVTIMR